MIDKEIIINGQVAVIKQCTPQDIDSIMSLQERAFKTLTNPDILRRNTYEMLYNCLEPPHYTLGAYINNRLIAFSVLYFPGDGKESIADAIDAEMVNEAANFKLVIVDSDYRGNGLQLLFSQLLEEYALKKGIKLLCATVSPDNPYSRNNFLKSGYTFHGTMLKYGGLKRDLFYKYI